MIKIENLHKTFSKGTSNEIYALQGLDLDVSAGEFVTIIGTNGSGKSTLLNAVSGSFLPDNGFIKIDGEDVSRQPDYVRAHLVSRVFQNPYQGTAPEMTILENLHMAYLRGSRRIPLIRLNAQRRRLYRERISLLEMQLEDRLDTIMGTLSGGQRQAVTLLMAVLRRPKVLLLDEHTAALDPKSASQVSKLTEKFITEEKLTALMVTHSMQQALDLGTRAIMLNKGKMIDDISIDEKQRMTVEDLLEKFCEIRKGECLTQDMILNLRREYL